MVALTDIAVGLFVIAAACFVGSMAYALYKEATKKE